MKYPKLGSHMSIAGGYHKAVEAGAKAGCDCVQLFTKNNNQWRAKPISDADANAFIQSLQDLQITDPLSHASYLINMAAPDDLLRAKSVQGLILELQRAEQLTIPNVVVHPGAFTTTTEQQGLEAIVESLTKVLQGVADLKVRVLLENTAGQGSTLGWKFEHLGFLLASVASFGDRVGICIDTCHAFAAGYDLSTSPGFDDTLQQMDKTFGLDRIKALHLNDSKKELGSHVDRHEHIGDGKIGIEGFERVLNHPILQRIPMYLETEKGVDDHNEDWDVVNLRRLRALIVG